MSRIAIWRRDNEVSLAACRRVNDVISVSGSVPSSVRRREMTPPVVNVKDVQMSLATRRRSNYVKVSLATCRLDNDVKVYQAAYRRP